MEDRDKCISVCTIFFPNYGIAAIDNSPKITKKLFCYKMAMQVTAPTTIREREVEGAALGILSAKTIPTILPIFSPES